MKKKFDAGAFLERLKTYFQETDNAGLGRRLGVSKQAISNWKTRNTLDFQLILEKCKEADLNVLFRGAALGFKEEEEIVSLKKRLEAVERRIKKP